MLVLMLFSMYSALAACAKVNLTASDSLIIIVDLNCVACGYFLNDACILLLLSFHRLGDGTEVLSFN